MGSEAAVFVDGSTGEGGGQLLRTSLSLACITGRELHIKNIRANRPRPGLASQHLSAVRAACMISDADCTGAEIGSRELVFRPKRMRSVDFGLDVGTAGSTLLVLQTLLPALFLADGPSTVTATGGTHNPLSPPFDFVAESFLPAIRRGGFSAQATLLRHGFYPAGGGKLVLTVEPWQEKPGVCIDLSERDEPGAARAVVCTANLPASIAAKQRSLLAQSELALQDVEHIEAEDSRGPGNCVMIKIAAGSHTTVLTSFGRKGKPSEEVIAEVVGAARGFLGSGAAVDHFLADQLVIYMAISRSGSFTTDTISSHLSTNIEMIRRFLPVYFSVSRVGEAWCVVCRPAE